MARPRPFGRKTCALYFFCILGGGDLDSSPPSATRSTRYPRERVRAEHGGAGGAVPAAAPAASKSVARSSASLGLHGAAALLEMSEPKGTAVDR